MAYSNNKLNLEKMLLKFLADEDPMLSMLKWLCEQRKRQVAPYIVYHT
jgi:hypothetical protein